jgi:hypothetical protein
MAAAVSEPLAAGVGVSKHDRQLEPVFWGGVNHHAFAQPGNAKLCAPGQTVGGDPYRVACSELDAGIERGCTHPSRHPGCRELP